MPRTFECESHGWSGQVPCPACESHPDQDGLTRVALVLCDACLSGKGGECHTPGCALWMNRAPDVPLHNYEVKRTFTVYVCSECGEHQPGATQGDFNGCHPGRVEPLHVARVELWNAVRSARGGVA